MKDETIEEVIDEKVKEPEFQFAMKDLLYENRKTYVPPRPLAE